MAVIAPRREALRHMVQSTGTKRPISGFLGGLLRNRPRVRLTVMFAIVLIATVTVAGCDPLQQAQDTQVPSAVHMGDDTLLWGPEIKEQALAMIKQSTVFCHLTMYELSDPDILNALADAARRNVDVEVVLDAKEPHSQSTAVPFLQSHHIKVRTLSISGGISHIKSLVTDNRDGLHALLGGMNFGQYSWENHDASVYFSHPNTSFENLFEQDYSTAGGYPQMPVATSLPLLYDSQIEPAMLAAISHATHSVVIEAFAFTSKSIIAALEAAAARGVSVKVLLDHKESYNRRTASELAAAGISVSYYTPYQGEYLHAKILSVDHGQVFIIGSANFSYHGFHVNHEGDVELFGASPFSKSLENDANIQISRGAPVSETAQY